MSVDVAYIVSHGFASRMLLQTDLLGKLVKEGKKVALITPDDKDQNLVEYCKTYGIEIFRFNRAGKFGSENYTFKRKYFLEDMKKNPALWEKHIVATRYNTSKHPIRILRPFYYGLIYKLIPYFPQIRENFKKQESKYLKSKEAEKLLEKIKSKKLISTYPVNINEATLLHYGNKDKTIETWIHMLSWDNITSKGIFPESADKYIAWGPIMKDELKEYYNVRDENIFECGVPHFDLHVQISKEGNCTTELQKIGLSKDRKTLFFAMSSPRFAPGEIDIVEWLADKVESGYFENTQLVVRPHPQNIEGNLADKTWLPRIEKLNGYKHTKVSYPMLTVSKLNWSMQMEDMVSLAKLLCSSHIVINSGSTVSIDGLMHKKPVIITSFDGKKNKTYWRSALRLIDYAHLKKMISFGGIDVVKSYPEFEKNISRYLENSNYNIENRTKTLLMECSKFDGTSTDAVLDVLVTN